MEQRTPAELMTAGENLPCGYPARPGKDAFKERLRHYKTCPHEYCRHRAAEGAKMALQLARGMKPR